MQEIANLYHSPSGLDVFRRELLPDADTEVTGGLVFLHGLGDHSGRHLRHLRYFADRGLHCVCLDLPGHGRTSGKRGYIDRMDTVTRLVDENVAYLRERLPAGAQIGIAGHSMGGFLSLYYLTGRPEVFDFAWISSPLIDPGYGVSRVTRLVGRLLSLVVPRLSLRSKVRSNMCKRDPEEIQASRQDPLIHRYMTLSLGAMLLKCSPELSLRCQNLSPRLKLLITHGSEDAICPSHLSQLYFDQLTLPLKRYELFDGLLHEPFNDIGKERVFEALENWLDEMVLDKEEEPETAVAA
jgi:acylglycerol lipase